MTFQEFDAGINRLKDCFGDRSYSDERCKVFWREFKDFNGRWWLQTVDYLIAHHRYPPLLAEFGEEMGKERERLRQLDKEEERQDAHDFFEGTYQNDDKRMLCQGIRDILLGKRTSEENAKFINLLQKTAEQTEKKTVTSAVTRGE